MLYPSPPLRLAEAERSPSKCARARACVCERARGPLIVSRTSTRRIDLSHGKRQIAVRRRSFASLGRGCGATSDREREGGGEERKHRREEEREERTSGGNPGSEADILGLETYAPTCLSASFRLAGSLGKSHVNGTNAARVRSIKGWRLVDLLFPYDSTRGGSIPRNGSPRKILIRVEDRSSGGM